MAHRSNTVNIKILAPARCRPWIKTAIAHGITQLVPGKRAWEFCRDKAISFRQAPIQPPANRHTAAYCQTAVCLKTWFAAAWKEIRGRRGFQTPDETRETFSANEFFKPWRLAPAL